MGMPLFGVLHTTGGVDLENAVALAAVPSGDEQDLVGNANGSFTCVGTTSPHTPNLLGAYGGVPGPPDYLALARDICRVGNYAYVASYGQMLVPPYNSSFTVVDAGDPYNPHTVAHLLNGSFLHIQSIDVKGSYAYVVTQGDNFVVVDISNPLIPVERGSFAFSGGIPQRVRAGPTGYMLVARTNFFGDGWLDVVDVSNPLLPAIVGSVQDPGLSGATGLVFASVYAFVSDQNGSLVIVDITNPGSPSIVSSTYFGWAQGDEGNSIAVNWSKRRAYISTISNHSIWTIDIHNLASPVLISNNTYGSPSDPMDEPRGVLYEGPLLYVASGSGFGGSLYVFDTRGNIGSVTPANGYRGQTLTGVVITGDEFSTASAVSFGAGITVNSYHIDSNQQITCSITIAYGAAIGLRDVSVTNLNCTATLYDGFNVLVSGIPLVTSVTPSSGQQGDVITVVLAGYNFTGVDSFGWIDFGQGMVVTAFTVDSDNHITLDLTIQLQAVAGARNVLVVNALGAGLKVNGFNVLVATGAIPTVASVTPNSGDQGTGPSSYIIAGTNFTTATDILVSGLGVSPGAFTIDGPTQITVDLTIVPQAIAGFRNVSVTNAIGTGTGVGAFRVTAPPGSPTVALITPNSGPPGVSLSPVIIAGTGFIGTTGIILGTGADIVVVSFGVDNPLQITLDITISPTAVPGLQDVAVTNAFGTGALLNGFTILAGPALPILLTVAPNSGSQGQHLPAVVIAGFFLTGATAVDFGAGITVTFSVDTDNQITADITIAGGAALGLRDIVVTNATGNGALLSSFTVTPGVLPPTVASATPNNGLQGQTLASVIIAGTNLTGATVVSFGAGITVNSFVVDNPLQITAANITISGTAVPGFRNVSVTTPAGTGTLLNGFTVNPAPPTVTGVSPNHGMIGQTINGIYVTGTYFTGATVIDFGADIAAVIASIDSPTQIRANIIISGLAAPGLRDVSVTTPGGTGTKTNGFRVTSGPMVTSFAPGIMRVPMTQVLRCG